MSWQNHHIFYVPVGLEWWSHSRGGSNPPEGGANLWYCQKLPKKCMQLRKFWAATAFASLAGLQGQNSEVFSRFKLVNHLTEFWYIVFLWFIFFLIESTKNTNSEKTQIFKDTTNKETESYLVAVWWQCYRMKINPWCASPPELCKPPWPRVTNVSFFKKYFLE